MHLFAIIEEFPSNENVNSGKISNSIRFAQIRIQFRCKCTGILIDTVVVVREKPGRTTYRRKNSFHEYTTERTRMRQKADEEWWWLVRDGKTNDFIEFFETLLASFFRAVAQDEGNSKRIIRYVDIIPTICEQ